MRSLVGVVVCCAPGGRLKGWRAGGAPLWRGPERACEFALVCCRNSAPVRQWFANLEAHVDEGCVERV